MEGFESMMGGASGKCLSDKWKDESLKYFDSWAEKGNGPVTRTLVSWFAWFQYREDSGRFPNRWNDTTLNG